MHKVLKVASAVPLEILFSLAVSQLVSVLLQLCVLGSALASEVLPR